MTADRKLEDWLADAALRQHTTRASEAFAANWNAGPFHARFDEAMRLLADPSAEAIAETVCGLFESDGWADALVDRLAAAAADDPFFEPPFPYIKTDIHEGLVVYRDSRVSIAAGVSQAVRLAAKKCARRGRTSIGFTGQLSVLKFIKAGHALISFWEAPLIGPDFTAATAGRCVRTGERRLGDGEVLVVDGRRQAYVIEQASSNLLILQAEIATDRAPLKVEYDSATLEFVACSAVDDSASRIQMLATLLRKLPHADGFAALEACLGHPDFFVRWHVMRELLGIDAGAALPHLKKMAASDPHPEPRRAARAVLDRLERSDAVRRKAA